MSHLHLAEVRCAVLHHQRVHLVLKEDGALRDRQGRHSLHHVTLVTGEVLLNTHMKHVGRKPQKISPSNPLDTTRN